mmetsp:Transcript_28353/g.80037  ORF Transcript_28353/g.80037 Transcript_28353/m.80037 type:complete len:262 (-) Transcript_28353:90-875(-)
MPTSGALLRLARSGVHRVADGVFQLSFGPLGSPWPNSFWLDSKAGGGGGVLVDAGTIFCGRRLLRQLDALHSELHDRRGDVLVGHALSHAHPDHSGASRLLCTTFEVPFWVGTGDAEVASGRKPMEVGPAWCPVRLLPHTLVSGQAHPVDFVMQDNQPLFNTGFTAVSTPGHTPGHFAFWRQEDRVLICGDVVAHFPWIRGRPGLAMPPFFFSHEARENRRSLLKLARLNPRVVACGHGQALHNCHGELQEFADRVQPLDG